MNKLKKIFLLAFIAFAMLSTIVSCKKSAFDINQNPNQPTDATVSYSVILPAALNNTARVVTRQWGFLQNYLSFWARSGTYAANTNEESYNITPNFGPVGATWNALYDNLYDYNVMQNKANADGATFYEGIAKIMKAHNYALLVDLYGNVPYTGALQGSANVTPSYDKGVDIYIDLLKQIDAGMALIAAASNSTTGPNKNIVTDDIMFSTPTTLVTAANINAQKVKWAKFGNTLKLRLLVHLMNGGISTPSTSVSGINLTTEFATLMSNPNGFLTASAEINPGYAADKPNPFYSLFVKDAAGTATANNVYYKANSVGLKLYSDNSDPRISLFYVAGASGMVGVKYGLAPITANSAANLAGIGPGVSRGPDKAAWIITTAESFFLQAEAIHRGFIPGGASAAKIAVDKGMDESCISLGSTAAAAASYRGFNAGYPDVDYSASTAATGQAGGLYTIISQKWLALNAIAPFEVWSDYRRVDFTSTVKHFVYGGAGGGHVDVVPQISVYVGNTKTEIPIRLPYPQTEYNYNPTNVASQGNIDIYSSKIFWDLN